MDSSKIIWGAFSDALRSREENKHQKRSKINTSFFDFIKISKHSASLCTLQKNVDSAIQKSYLTELCFIFNKLVFDSRNILVLYNVALQDKLLDIEDFQFYDYEDDISSSSASASSDSSFNLYSNLTNLFKCKNLFVGIGMCFFYQFAGYNVVANYAGSILQAEEELLFNTTSLEKIVNVNESSTTAE